MKISILTPSFNSAKYIERAIMCVKQQDYGQWEHIVMDGGSTDGTSQVISKYPHIIWVSEKDKGQSDAMNKAFAMSTGDIIIYLNADDELNPGLFSHLVELFGKFPEKDMVIGNLNMSANGEVKLRVPSVSLLSILSYWPCKFPLNPVAYAYKRSLQEKIGPFPVSNHFSMDYWFLLRAYLYGKIVKSERVFGTYYNDGANKSSDITRAKEQLKIVRNGFLTEFWYVPTVLAFTVKFLLSISKKALLGR